MNSLGFYINNKTHKKKFLSRKMIPKRGDAEQRISVKFL